jgi:hypothetical protein
MRDSRFRFKKKPQTTNEQNLPANETKEKKLIQKNEKMKK